jgi:copper(I)-binding protein
VELRSGGLHVMLIGLKHQLKPGDQVPLTLIYATRLGNVPHDCV